MQLSFFFWHSVSGSDMLIRLTRRILCKKHFFYDTLSYFIDVRGGKENGSFFFLTYWRAFKWRDLLICLPEWSRRSCSCTLKQTTRVDVIVLDVHHCRHLWRSRNNTTCRRNAAPLLFEESVPTAGNMQMCSRIASRHLERVEIAD